jgi:hypothetical protein
MFLMIINAGYFHTVGGGVFRTGHKKRKLPVGGFLI